MRISAGKAACSRGGVFPCTASRVSTPVFCRPIFPDPGVNSAQRPAFNRKENLIKLQSGDIGATRGRGPLGFLHRKLFAPATDRFHYLLIWKPYRGGDWIILESISKGLSVGLLSWYKGDIKYYRIDCPVEIRKRAPLELVKWGRSKYDYFLVGKIIAGYFLVLLRVLITEGRLRRIKAEELPYAKNSSLICSEAVQIGYLAAGFPIINPEIVPLPSAFREAELNGIIFEI